MFFKKKIALIVLILVFTFGYVVFSDVVDTMYTEFYFMSGGDTYNSYVYDLTGGETFNFSVYLENKSNLDLSGKFYFVDGSYVVEGLNTIRVCGSNNETENFGQYVDVSNPSFTVSPGETISKILNLTFPAWYSGLYLGCVVYVPNTIKSDGYLNTVVRKAIFLDVDVAPTSSTLNVKVYPSNRYSPTYKGNYGKMFFYANGDRTSVLYSGFLTTNTDGMGTYTEDIESGIYDVVYKGQSHLASYLSGVILTGGVENTIDFTKGSNLYLTIKEGLDGYQIAGDFKNVNGNYDGEVNIGDIIILIGSTGYINENSVDQYNEYNLNGDGVLNNIDLSVVIANFSLKGSYYNTTPIFDGFSW